MTLSLFNEWLEKQTQFADEAKRRGLVPQSGDWKHPYRWVKPKDKDVQSPTNKFDTSGKLKEQAVARQDRQAYKLEKLNLIHPDDIDNGGYSNVIKWSDAEDLVEPTLLKDASTTYEELTENRELYKRAKKLGLDKVTVWHGTTATGATGIYESGAIHPAKTGGGFGVGFNMSPKASTHWAGGSQIGPEYKDSVDVLPIVIQFDIDVELLKDITYDQSEDAYSLNNNAINVPIDENTKILYSDEPDNPRPQKYFNLLDKQFQGIPEHLLQNTQLEKQSPAMLDAKRRGLVPQSGNWEKPYRWVKPEEVEEAKPTKTSSYEMPKYDLSWEALHESEFKDTPIEYVTLTEKDYANDFYQDSGMKPTDKVMALWGTGPRSFLFGSSEQAIKDKILAEYTTPSRATTFINYKPPRLTPKPEWATDSNDPFPEIPSDIKEIHYDDIPEFYAKNNYGDALQQFEFGDKSLKGVARKLVELGGMDSERFYEALKCVDGKLDYSYAAEVFSEFFPNYGGSGKGVTEKQAKLAIEKFQDMTQKSIEHRGLPEKFYVFRGGEVHGDDIPTPTSLSPGTAALNYFSQKGAGEPYVAMYEVNRDDILLDLNAMKPDAQHEEELTVLGRNLKNPIKIRLSNRNILNPEFFKLQQEVDEADKVLADTFDSLDKVTGGLSSPTFRDFRDLPPDEEVAARMKARGLEWKKETHRWVRPEEDDESDTETKIHELSGDRDEFFDALMERFLEKRDSTAELTNEQKMYFSHIKDSLDKDTDELLEHVKDRYTQIINETRDMSPSERDKHWWELADELRKKMTARTYIPELYVNAKNSVIDTIEATDVESDAVLEFEGDTFEISSMLTQPYIISQLKELEQNVQEIFNDEDKHLFPKQNEYSPFFAIHNIRDLLLNSMLVRGDDFTHEDVVDLYLDGVLDIDNSEGLIRGLTDSLRYSILNFGDTENLNTLLNFSRDNLFKFDTNFAVMGNQNLILMTYTKSSSKDKKFMRDSLVNSFKDKELLSLIKRRFSGDVLPSDVSDVLSTINQLSFSIFSDMLSDGDIDGLVEFFSDENIPMGILNRFGAKSMEPTEDTIFHALSQNMTAEEFTNHVDTFLGAGRVLRQAGVEALHYVDPSHPALLNLAKTETDPTILSSLANILPLTFVDGLLTNLRDLKSTDDIDSLRERANSEYISETPFESTEEFLREGFLTGVLEPKGSEELALIVDEDGDYLEPTRLGQVTKEAMEAVRINNKYYNKIKSVNDSTLFKANARVDTVEDKGLSIQNIEEFQSALRNTDSDFSTWADSLDIEFIDELKRGFDPYEDDPGLPAVFDELYWGTKFGSMHTDSKSGWEGSSSSVWGGILKESVGRQFDDKVIYHSQKLSRESIDDALERERNSVFNSSSLTTANMNQENLDEYVRIHKNMTRALLDRSFPFSDTFEVWRGSEGEVTEDEFRLLTEDYQSATINQNSLSSYSLSEDTAIDFAEKTANDGKNSVVLSIPELHKDNIWSTFWSHSYDGNEREVLVINDPNTDISARKYAEEFIATDLLNANYIDDYDIEQIYGLGWESQDYVNEFKGDSTELAQFISDSLFDAINDPPLFPDEEPSPMTKYLTSSKYDEGEFNGWVSYAAERIMDEAVENYDFKVDIPSEQSEALDVYDRMFRDIWKPDDLLGKYSEVSDLADDIFDTEKSGWGGTPLYTVPLTNDEDEEELRRESETIAKNLWEWAEEGNAKVGNA